MALPVSYVDLVLGAKIEIPHIDDSNLIVNISPGSKPGDTITITNRGYRILEVAEEEER